MARSAAAGPQPRQLAAAALLLVPAAALLLLGSVPFAAAQLRFAAVGNYGFDPEGQKTVAATLKSTAQQERISYLVSPGSNFPRGVTGSNDTVWEDQFEEVYTDPSGALKMPFLTVLGAEDWAGNYTAMQQRTDLVYGDQPSEESTSNAPKWTLPNWWYHYTVHFPVTTGSAFISTGHKDMSLGMVFVDTWVLSSSFPFGHVTEKAWLDLEKTLSVAPKVFDYIVVVGNKPVYSSGSSKGDSMLQYYLQPMLKKAGVDAYISGADHDLEVIVEGETAYVNCGTGSVAGSNALVSASGSKFFSPSLGFCLFELAADGLEVTLVDGNDGSELFVHKQPLKTRPERATLDQFSFLSELPEVVYTPVPEMGKLPGRDSFVRVVGTIGLCIASLLAAITAASAVSKAMK